MKQSWDDYEKAADAGPLQIFWKALLALVIMGIALGLVGTFFGWFGEASTVAQRELGPSAVLAKYSWFKESATVLEKKRADIQVYDARAKALSAGYDDAPRSKWTREDREQANVWASEIAGIKASYNQLAAEYNAKMAEAHWRFANRGELPQGATEPLPREFKPYIEE